MPYATHADVSTYARARGLAELAQESGATLDSNGETRITGEILEQSQFMDGFLIAKHDVPITGPANVLAILKTHCVRLVMRGLYGDRAMSPEFVRSDAEETVKWLQGVQKTGIRTVVTPSESELPEQSIDAASGEQVFGLEGAFL